jgi:peptidoglycan/LPS O-acetylase OafA/YrhL
MSLKPNHDINPHYRPDIDGLRAIGVASVVIFHAFPLLLRGGFIGVDIFFVISGFLISGIIFNALSEEKFSLRDFYIRRIRRIFPALLLVLAATIALGFTQLLPHQLAQLGKHVLAGSTFVSNLVLSTESGYFDTASDEKPLLHLWSLGVEEQFYMFWPLLVMAAWRFRNGIFYSTAVVFVVSMATNILQTSTNPSLAFYLPFGRLWELLVGASLAYAVHFRGNGLERLVGSRRSLISALGLAAVILGFSVINRWQPFPGGWALLPTLGCAAMIAAGPTAFINRRLLSHPAALFLGKISYPLYLWHWPLLVYLNIHALNNPSPAARLALVALAVMLAWLTCRLIETPIKGIKNGSRVVMALGTSMFAMAVAGTYIYLEDSNIIGGPRSAEKSAYLDYFGESTNVFDYIKSTGIPEKYRYDCDFYTFPGMPGLEKNGFAATIPESCTQHRKPHQIFIWGDSHAQQFNYGLKKNLPETWDVLQVASSGCPAELPETDSSLDFCIHSNWVALNAIKLDPPEFVLIAQKDRHNPKQLTEVARKILSLGVKHVFVMGPVPHWSTTLPIIMVRQNWDSSSDRETRFLHSSTFVEDNVLREYFAGNPSITYLSPLGVLCNADGCLTRLGPDKKRDITTWDTGHMTPVASDFVVRELLIPLLAKKRPGALP